MSGGWSVQKWEPIIFSMQSGHDTQCVQESVHNIMNGGRVEYYQPRPPAIHVTFSGVSAYTIANEVCRLHERNAELEKANANLIGQVGTLGRVIANLEQNLRSNS